MPYIMVDIGRVRAEDQFQVTSRGYDGQGDADFFRS